MPHPLCSHLWDCSQGNPPAAERLAEALWAAMRAADALLTEHAPRCTGSMCGDARGLLWAMNHAENSIVNSLRPWPAANRQYAEDFVARRNVSRPSPTKKGGR